MPELLIIHIGPVQEFIAAARRSRDLWFGSWLLSELSKAAAHSLASENGARLIFPAASTAELKEGTALNVANKVLAVVMDDAAGATHRAHSAVNRRLTTLAKGVFDGVTWRNGKIDRALADAQIDDLLEFYWAAVPLADDLGDYAQRRAALEAAMAARKSTRNFGALAVSSSDRGVPKSSLDGSRESVIDEGEYAEADAPADVHESKAKLLYTRYKARRAERLSGVDLLKRLGGAEQAADFPSTSHVAILPYTNRLQLEPADSDRHAKRIERFVADLRAKGLSPEQVRTDLRVPLLGDHDGSLLFEGRLNELTQDRNLREAAKEMLRDLLRELAPDGIKPQPYYALLLGDGDFMGRAIEARETVDEHQSFSQTLSTFAGEAKEIVGEYDGALVYAGGDDVLAFLPVHRALQCAQAISAKFNQIMNGPAGSNDEPMTFSAGLVIAHHLSPLAETLALARAAERVAKSHPGKNALAITISKRSGADRTIVGTWSELGERLTRAIEWSQLDLLPARAAYQLRELALRLADCGDDDLDRALRAARSMEAHRILLRKQGERGKRERNRRIAGAIVGWLDAQSDINHLADLLIIAQDFAAVFQLAHPLDSEEHEKEAVQ